MNVSSNRYSKDGSYITGAAVSGAEGWLVLANDDLVRKEIAHAGFFYLKDTLLKPVLMRKFRARFCGVLPKHSEQIIGVGDDGQVVIIAADGSTKEETLRIDGVAPESRGPLRSGSVVQNEVVMVGMDRQVYRRVHSGAWISMEAGLPAPTPEKTTGFEGVAGHRFECLYAVGWEGEIWRFDGKQWRAVNSPTDRILTAVCVDDSGTVYACGRSGLVVRGAQDAWKSLDTGCHDDLWGIASFAGQIFAASLTCLYKLEGDALARVDIAGVDSFGTFSACDEALWSIGAKATLSFDGRQWRHIA